MIRRATTEDALRIAGIHVTAWRAAYRGLMTDDFLDGLDIARRHALWNGVIGNGGEHCVVFVSSEGGGINGFCHIAASRDADAGQAAEIIAIYLEPQDQRRGYGRALCSEARSFARDAGYQFITLWVLEANAPARRFYETMGFHPDGAAKVAMTPGFSLEEIRYRQEILPSTAAIIRSLESSDDIDEITWLLHRAYMPLAEAGLRFTATHQTPGITHRRLKRGHALVAVWDGRVVGTVTVYAPEPGSEVPLFRHAFHFGQFCVDPEYKGRGIGRALHQSIIDYARAQGGTAMALDTATPAVDLIATYHRWGYVIEDRIRFPTVNYESVIMRKELS